MTIHIIDQSSIVLDVVARELKKIDSAVNIMSFNDISIFLKFSLTSENPKLIITDINWMEYSNDAWVNKLHEIFPLCPILVYSSTALDQKNFPQKPKISSYFFYSYISKKLPLDVFVTQLKKIMSSNKLIDSENSDHFNSISANKFKASKKQKQIMILLNRGYSSENIANQLAIKPHTLKIHLYRLYKKINVSSRTEALFYFKSKNLIQD